MQRYEVEHDLIPILLYSERAREFLPLLRRKKAEMMVDLYSMTQEGTRVPCPYPEEEFQVESTEYLGVTEADTVYMLSVEMPEPLDIAACRRGFICCQKEDENIRYFTVEKSGAGDMLCGWDPDRRHTNFGRAPEEREEQIRKVLLIYRDWLDRKQMTGAEQNEKGKPEENQLYRILRYEGIYEETREAVQNLQKAMARCRALEKSVKELAAYYEGPLWKQDFEDDEAGKIPKDLKRGVLSEDGVYNLLSDYEELMERKS